MKVSVIITVLNEAETIRKLLLSLVNQTKKPSEIVIIDAGSKDDTIQIIKAFTKSTKIQLKVSKGISRSKARNLGVKISHNEIIAMTDAGCIPHKDWLEKITKPFVERFPSTSLSLRTQAVAGFYQMVGKSHLQKAMIPYLGTTPRGLSDNFLPSTRSIAFRKSVWKKVHGFDEKLNGAAEDTMFNVKLLKNDVKMVIARNAIVEWGMPQTLFEFACKLFGYSKGDLTTKIFIHPTKGIWSHNIHTLTIFLRYLAGLVLLFLVLFFDITPVYLLFCILIYFIWSILKVRDELFDWRVRLFTPIIQVTSDIAVMLGFIWGIFGML